MGATVAATGDERKHTFDSGLDIERTFGNDTDMQRTYVRRRRVVAAAALLAVLAIGSPVARAVGGSDGSDGATVTYVVRPGDTLWSVAQRHAPGEDPREVVHEIAALNELGHGPLLPGRSLVLPDLA